MSAQELQVAGTRSTFVTVLAWIFIVLAGLSTLIALLQNIVINTIMPFDQIRAAQEQAGAQIPAFARIMMDGFRWIFLAFLIVSATTLAAAIGLLRRRNWARVTFVGVLGLGIVWNIGGVILQRVMLTSMGAIPANMSEQAVAEFQNMSQSMFIVGAIMALGFSVLYGWLIMRLLLPQIRAEFVEAP